MKETPIIFNTENVRAILEDRKTQTRRVIKPQPALTISDEQYKKNMQMLISGGDKVCPYGQVGDRLWLRETWAYGFTDQHPERIIYKADNTPLPTALERGTYSASAGFGKWAPAIHMFHKDSRITLEITGVRVERLQEIPYYEIPNEGIQKDTWSIGKNRMALKTPDRLRADFKHLWDSLNAKPKPRYIKGAIAFYESYPWEDIQETRTYRGKAWYVHGNPWVWSIAFKRTDK